MSATVEVLTKARELIAELEAASSGAFVLDLAIGVLVGHPFLVPPAYTVSLDAALRLVPEGWGWLVGSPYANGETGTGLPWAEIWKRGHGHVWLGGATTHDGRRNLFNAATPALALCIAALKARAGAP